MKLISSLAANQYRMYNLFGEAACLLFEGTRPESMEDMPFDPKDLKAALDAAVLQFKSPRYVEQDSVNNKVILEYRPVNSARGSVDFLSANVSTLIHNQITPKVSIEEDDYRTFAEIVNTQYTFIPQAINSVNRSDVVRLSDYYWTYFDFEKLIDLYAININFGEDHEYFEMEYYDEELQRWVDTINPDSEEGFPDVIYSGNSISGKYTRSQTDLYRYSWKPGRYWRYRYWYVSEIRPYKAHNTRRVRVRTGNLKNTRNYPEHYNDTLNAARIAFSTTTDISELQAAKTITPTWGIAYGGSNSNYPKATLNDFFVFSVGTENADLVISEATFDPHTTKIEDIAGSLKVELDHLTGES